MPSRYEKKFLLPSSSSTSPTVEGYVANMDSTLGVIVTHPWGVLGGNMYNNVVNAIVLYFQTTLHITTVRFNFQGSQISRGYDQVEQVIHVAKQLLSGELFTLSTNNDNNNNHNNNQQQSCSGSGSSRSCRVPKYILLIGYSYGSLISSSASISIPQCIGTISIAPPFGVSHWLLLFNHHYHLMNASKRSELYFQRLFILGTKDNFTSEQQFTKTIQQYFSKEITNTTNPTTSNSSNTSTTISTSTTTAAAIIQDVDHFFIRREKDIVDVIGEWLLFTAYPNELLNQNDLHLLRTIEIQL